MEPIRIGKDRQVFWDSALIDCGRTNTLQRVMEPVRKECCFWFDQPNETFSISYPCIVRDDAGYKLYYQPWNEDLTPSVCVIESTDGIRWHRN